MYNIPLDVAATNIAIADAVATKALEELKNKFFDVYGYVECKEGESGLSSEYLNALDALVEMMHYHVKM